MEVVTGRYLCIFYHVWDVFSRFHLIQEEEYHSFFSILALDPYRASRQFPIYWAPAVHRNAFHWVASPWQQECSGNRVPQQHSWMFGWPSWGQKYSKYRTNIHFAAAPCRPWWPPEFLHYLIATPWGQSDVSPSRKPVFLVPETLSVAQEDDFVLLNCVMRTVAFEKRYWSCLVSI